MTSKFTCFELSVAFLRSATYLTTTTASGAKGPPAGQVNKPRSNLDPGWACKVALAMQTARWIDLFVVLGLSTPVATITCAVVSWTRTATDSVQPWVPGSQRFVRIESVLRVAGDGTEMINLKNFTTSSKQLYWSGLTSPVWVGTSVVVLACLAVLIVKQSSVLTVHQI